jgi:serine/threonine protein kinase
MTTVDMWSIGCIFAEMISGKPLFTGTSEADQLKKIFKIRGTPKEKDNPEFMKYPEWNSENYEDYKPQALEKYVPKIDKEGLDLLEVYIYII